jgi:MIP family channel proteins
MDKNLRPYLAELIGTFALVFLGAGTVLVSRMAVLPGQPQPYVVGIALAEGFILAVMLSATVNISGGYLNPAITLMLWVYKRMDGVKASWLIGAQLLGAVLAGMCLRPLFSDNVMMDARLGTPHLNLEAFGLATGSNPGFPVLLTGIGIETALTFVLTFAIFGTMIDPRGPRLAGLGVGLALSADILMGYALTGAAANPARWFGTVIWEQTVPVLTAPSPFKTGEHTVYWIGPIVGALLAGGIYTMLIMPPEEEEKSTAPSASVGVPAGAGSTLFRAKK